jgi:hypothetical protein
MPIPCRREKEEVLLNIRQENGLYANIMQKLAMHIRLV